jgi:hypothetical protein
MPNSQLMKKLILSQSTIDEIEVAMEDASYEVDWHLDTETGEVFMFGPDIPAFDVAPRHDDPDWIKESHAKQVEVWNDTSGRYLHIPGADSREGWQDMDKFIATVEDEALRERLAYAIGGRGAFRRFKDKLAEDLDERRRWFDFKRTRTHQRIRDWLMGEGFELVVD